MLDAELWWYRGGLAKTAGPQTIVLQPKGEPA